MLPRHNRWLAILAVLVLSSALCVQAIDLGHPHGPKHCCRVCHSGHQPVLQPARFFSFSFSPSVVWHVSPEEPTDLAGPLVTGSSSRAPPA
jgi:hypothetical protein